jgi:serine/threonine-protein kinase
VTPERWAQIQQIRSAALEQAPQERSGWVDSACGNDQELRNEVGWLLAQSEDTMAIPSAVLAPAISGISPGDTVAHYQVTAKIGAGGMGEVWMATDSVLRRPVALKVLHPHALRDEAARSHFLREGRSIAALSHPNIAGVYEVGEHNGMPYLAMEYVDGASLLQELDKGPLPHARLVDSASQIAAALDHAHSRGIAHRDVKPGNILVDARGAIKLVDFGLAKQFTAGESTDTALTGPGRFVGTLRYAAPEVLSGRPADVRSDIYSLGVVLYEMACGVSPFSGMEGQELVAAILSGSVPPIRQRNPTLLPALIALIERAMAVRPEARFGSAGEVQSALSNLGRTATPQPAEETSGTLAVLDFETSRTIPPWTGWEPASPKPCRLT